MDVQCQLIGPDCYSYTHKWGLGNLSVSLVSSNPDLDPGSLLNLSRTQIRNIQDPESMATRQENMSRLKGKHAVTTALTTSSP